MTHLESGIREAEKAFEQGIWLSSHEYAEDFILIKRAKKRLGRNISWAISCGNAKYATESMCKATFWKYDAVKLMDKALNGKHRKAYKRGDFEQR